MCFQLGEYTTIYEVYILKYIYMKYISNFIYFGQKYINKMKPDSIKPQNPTTNLW